MDSKVYSLTFTTSPPTEFFPNTIYVRKFAEDTVGTTYGAAWVEVFNENQKKEIALYKPLDYDEPLGAYAELLSSYLYSLCLKDVALRVPKINMVLENGNLGLLSYSILDNITEDLIHMEALMFYKYERRELKKFFTLGVNDILECIKHEVCNYENFLLIRKAVIFNMLLDAFTNNVDRHGKNWGLVRNKETNHYELAMFDNVKAFINIFFNRPGYKDKDLWAITYNGSKASSNIESGDMLCEFIKRNYPDEFQEFLVVFSESLIIFYDSIKDIKTLDSYRIFTYLKKKLKFFTKQDEV